MRLSLAAVVLLALTSLAGCGSDDEPASSASTTPTATEAAATESDACITLARTWAVKARALDTALLLMVEDRIKEATTAMTAATDDMEIEGCTGPAQESATMGNYQASLAAVEVRICVIHEATTCEKAHDEWKQNGSPVVARVRELSGLE